MSGENGSGEGDGGAGKTGSVGADNRSAKWRCDWCGKPHERNDPPCDNCGHHKFERAVVPVAPANDDYVPDPIWVCPECGRQHQKNSPPCSRCGNATLEKRIPDDEDYAAEIGGTSYLDLLEPQFVLGFAVAILAAAALVLAMLGVITLPGMDGGDLTVENVPGAADVANGVDLADVERAYLAEINQRRTDAGRDELTPNDRLGEVAVFANQRWVKSVYGDATTPSTDRLGEAIAETCRGGRPVYFTFDARAGDGDYDSADALAAVLVEEALGRDRPPTAVEGSLTGVDVHVGPDDRVYLSQFVC